MRVACLVDTTRCIGCRSCQVACKQANALKGEETKFFAAPGGYQNPSTFSPYTNTFVSYHELQDDSGGLNWVFVKHQCMHCADMPCALVCAPEIFSRTATGVVVTDAARCMGCAACIKECPFDVPVIDFWDVDTPHLRKCNMCFQRQESELKRARLDGRPLSAEAAERFQESFQTPACAKACPTGAIQFGDRDKLLAEGRRRIAAEPDKYVDHIYGEKELGGLGWLYLASVPFEQLGLPIEFGGSLGEQFEDMGRDMGRRHRPGGLLSRLSGGLATIAAAACWFFRRRDEVRNMHEKRENSNMSPLIAEIRHGGERSAAGYSFPAGHL